MTARTYHFLTGISLPLTVSPLWPVALPALIYLYARKLPRPVLPRPSRTVLTVCALFTLSLVLPLAFQGRFRLSPTLTVFGYLLGSAVLLVICTSLVRWNSYRKFEFWFGVFIVVVLHSILSASQRFLPLPFLDDGGASRAFQNNSSLAGFFASSLMLTPVAPFAGVSLAFSVSRSYLLASVLLALYVRNWKLLACCVVAGLFIFWYTPARISYDGLRSSFVDRVELNTVPLAWKWYGMGFWQFNETTALQAPHNIWVLSWYELGIFSILLWSTILFGIVRYRAFHFLPLLAAGLFTPELYDRPESLGGLVMYQLGFSSYVARK